MWKVSCLDDSGKQSDAYFDSRKAGIVAIENSLNNVKKYLNGLDYDYMDFINKDGSIGTEIWTNDSGEWTCWTLSEV